MPWVALACYALYLLLAFVLRSVVQLRRTGSTGFRGISGRLGAAERVSGALFALALAGGAAAPALALADVAEPVGALDGAGWQGAGVALFAAGLAGTLGAQLAMGRSWRIGVDPDERTELVVHGPFAAVRNPIFTAMLPTSLGLTLMVPSWVALASLAALFVALELQVRRVEEPYLLRVHGEAYARYAERVGRFVPGLGRLRAR